MPDKTPADRTVTAPSDATPRTADAHSLDALTKRIGGLLHRRAWYQLPRFLAYARLVEIRNELREKNLHDTEEPPLEKQAVPPRRSRSGHPRRRARPTGRSNDLQYPRMGAVGCRFGRNVPLEHTVPDTANLLVPNPRTVSRELMTRDQFQPATILNLLAASWIQFMVHDWFVHKRSKTDVHRHPDAARRRLRRADIRVPRSVPEPAPAGSTRPPAYANLNSHWWDASQIYGCDREMAAKLRTQSNGKLRIEPTGLLPVDPETGVHFTGFTDNWWIGLAMLHTLFTLEHNYICDLLAHQHPRLDRRAALPQGETDQLRADGEDPHRRVDAGDRAAPDHQDRDERELVRPGRRGSPGRARVPRRQASCSAASSARTPTITPRRIR